MAIVGDPGAMVVCDKISIGDNCSDIAIDGMIFSSGDSEVLRVRPQAKGISNVIIGHCGFLGRGINLAECSAVTVTDCVSLKRGLSVGANVVDLTVRHCLFIADSIMLEPRQVTLFDNIFAPNGEAWILLGNPTPGFKSDYNFIQTGDPGKFAWIAVSDSKKTLFPNLSDWRLKTKQDAHSFGGSDAEFADPANGDYSLKPTSYCRGKASDHSDLGPRWSPSQWRVFQQAFSKVARAPLPR